MVEPVYDWKGYLITCPHGVAAGECPEPEAHPIHIAAMCRLAIRRTNHRLTYWDVAFHAEVEVDPGFFGES